MQATQATETAEAPAKAAIRTNELRLIDALRSIVCETMNYPPTRPNSSHSYLPEPFILLAQAALAIYGLDVRPGNNSKPLGEYTVAEVANNTLQETPANIPPAPGQHWPAQGGTYIGVAPAEGDLPMRHLVVLDAEPAECLTWADAVKWAQDQGDGARLPTQLEALFAFTTSKAAFKREIHWTGTQSSSDYAFAQNFEYGYSYWYDRDDEFRVRAFRAVPL